MHIIYFASQFTRGQARLTPRTAAPVAAEALSGGGYGVPNEPSGAARSRGPVLSACPDRRQCARSP